MTPKNAADFTRQTLQQIFNPFPVAQKKTTVKGSGEARVGVFPSSNQNVQTAPSTVDQGNSGQSQGIIYTPGSGSSGSGSATSYPDLSGAIAILRQNIAALDPVYQAELERADKDYEIAMNERLANYNAAKAASEASDVSNAQNVLTSRNAINKNTRMSSEDILSILGALGMGGSTRQKALGAIADKSNAGLNEANFSYGKNKQSILQSWNDFVNKDINQQKQIADAREYAKAQAGITRDTGKKNMLQQIASNQIEMGQDTGGVLNEMAGLNNSIAGLSKVNRTYTGQTPTYTAPAISEILGQNMSRFDVNVGKDKKTAPKLIKVNEQTGSGNRYGLV